MSFIINSFSFVLKFKIVARFDVNFISFERKTLKLNWTISEDLVGILNIIHKIHFQKIH
jgi:hypothetical protein